MEDKVGGGKSNSETQSGFHGWVTSGDATDAEIC